jgi:fructosamine-3-kinase
VSALGGMTRSLADAITRSLRAAVGDTAVDAVTRVGGGDINQAALVTTRTGRYFVKWHNAPPPRFFECEAAGLSLLGAAGAVRVPGVVAHGAVPGSRVAYLILEWIDRDGGGRQRAAERLGRGLARQHAAPQPEYGLDHDNYIGRLPQPNRQTGSWVDFYRTERLGAQRDQARANGLLPAGRAERLDRLMARLDEWIDEEQCQPSLLHGDLWGGNWMVDAAGGPVLIDPAVYVGDREADLAMTALFGGFPPAFYDAYREEFPLAPGYEDRQPLYQLYYLLCHLNLFGESYGGSVDRILRRYAG